MADVSMLHDFPPPRRWRASWIWGPGDPGAKNAYLLFRRELHLDALPDAALLHLTADTRYQLFVNGAFIARGAPQSQPYFQYYDQRDLRPHLREGDNCIGIIVNHVGNLVDTRGGLLAELVGPDGHTLLRTDDAWRVTRCDAWRADTFVVRMNQATPYQEHFDSRRIPPAWHSCGFDDRSWDAAVVVGARPPAAAPWTRLVPRDIPDMTNDPTPPQRIERVEECLDLADRTRGNDLSISLSMVGRPIEHSRLEHPDSLLGGEGQPLVAQCSTKHFDRVFDGVYDPCVVVDFGRVVTAYPRIELAGVDGGVLEIGYAERLIDGHFNNAVEGQFADRYVMRDGDQTWQPFAWKAFRYLKLRFRSCFAPVTVRSLQAMVTTFPFEERGAFRSSDATLNGAWEISRYTLRLCSNEFIMDTPWREQGQWLGDVAAVTLGGLYACFGDTQLTGKFVRQSAANQFPTGLIANMTNTCTHNWARVIPDYSLWWLMGLWNHYHYTGERKWIDEFYPVALRIFQAHLPYVNAHGLIEDMPYWVFIDWADVEKRGESAAYNALFHGAVLALGRLAERKGDASTQAKCLTLLRAMRESFPERLLDANRGVFADARIDDALSPKVSEHANLAAIRWGLCDADTARGIVRRLYEERSVAFTECQPFFTVVVLQALAQIGRFDLAVRIVRERWGERMVQRGDTSTREEWYTNGSWRSGGWHGFLRTRSHAWSAAPAEFLIRSLMGLEIVEAGCKRVTLAPQETEFDYDVTFPTPRGPIRVQRSAGRTDVTVPPTIQVGNRLGPPRG